MIANTYYHQNKKKQQQPMFMFTLTIHCILLLQSCYSLSTPPRTITPKTTTTTNNNNEKSYFATCIPGLSKTLSQELNSLGASNVEICGASGVSFTSSSTEDDESGITIGLKAMVWSRTAHKIMELIASSSSPASKDKKQRPKLIENREDLYSFVRESIGDDVISKYIPKNKKNGELHTISCQCIGSNPNSEDLSHTHYTALTVKNALVDACRDYYKGQRPNVDTTNPDVPFILILHDNTATLYRCLNNESLHKRGYRSSSPTAIMHKASLKETLAAGLLLNAGWDKLIHHTRYKDESEKLPAVLIDPMTGSGTFLLEGLLLAANIAPGLLRHKSSDLSRPPVLRWKNDDDTPTNMDLYKTILIDAALKAKDGITWLNKNKHRILLYGNDEHGGALQLANQAIQTLNQHINYKDQTTTLLLPTLSKGDCQNWKIPPNVITPGRTIVVCNPPWGKRLADAEESWISLKLFLRQHCNGCEAWVLSGNKYCTPILRMKKSTSFSFQVGQERLKWLQYHIYSPPSSDGDKMDVVGTNEAVTTTSNEY